MAHHVVSAPPVHGPATEPGVIAGPQGPQDPAAELELPGTSPEPGPPITRLCPACRLANAASVPPRHVVDLDSRAKEMYRRQLPIGVIQSEPVMVCLGKHYRGIHRRPFSCQMEVAAFVVRDVHVACCLNVFRLIYAVRRSLAIHNYSSSLDL